MRRNSKYVCVPELCEVEQKMPNPLIPINWEKRYGKENARYEEKDIYDKNGNYVKTIKNVFVKMEKVMNYHIYKRKAKRKDLNSKSPKRKKLFPTNTDLKKTDEEIFKDWLSDIYY